MRYLVFLGFLMIGCNGELKIEENSGPYTELYRPQFHFSPPANWMNDPNGMVFYEGEYHLFYQYYPDSTVWGPMHWGHAVSPDMVSWENLPIALYPDSLGYIFSGSAVMDLNNTSGFGKNGEPPMVAIFTHHNIDKEKAGDNDYQYQSIAYSLDKGRTWSMYDQNPVITNPGIKDFRDPKVIWSDEFDKWIMAFAADDHIKFYSSPDLKNWEHTGDFGKGHGNQSRPWECPDLFPMKIAGTDLTKWVLIVSVGKGGPNGGSATQYFVGDFDGRQFINENTPETTLWLDHGKDNYAGVTWADIPPEDGRKLFIGWMSNWQYAQVVPTEKWRSAMTIPRELKLMQTSEGSRIYSVPVKELSALRNEHATIQPQSIMGKMDLLKEIKDQNGLYELHLEFERPESEMIRIVYSSADDRYLSFGFDPENQTYFVDRSTTGDNSFNEDFGGKHTSGLLEYQPQKVIMDVFIDHSSIEIFADSGRTILTEIFFPTEKLSRLEIDAPNGGVKLLSADVYTLNSIWKDQ